MSLTTTLTLALTIPLLLLTTTTHALLHPPTEQPSATQAPRYSLNDIIPELWLNAATYSLLCYDAITMGLLCWLWLCGHLGWMKEDMRVAREVRVDGQRRGRQTLIEGEMRRLGMI
jgi:hypothetical protein